VLSHRCVLSEQTLRRAMDLALKAAFFRVLRVLEPLLAAVSLALLIWALAKGLGTAPVLFYSLLLAASVFFYVQQFIRYPRRAVKNQLLRQAADWGTPEPEARLWFGPESVARCVGDADEPQHMPYEKIRSVREDGELIVLLTRSRNVIPLPKDGFENGTAEDLWRLLARRAPQARLYRREQP